MSEKVKLYTAAALAAVGVLAYFLVPLHYGRGLPAIALGVLLLLAVAVFFLSQASRDVIQFFRDSYVELRKVVWPTRSELLRSTAVVLALIVVIALFLWLIDMALLTIVRFALGGA
ncbi:MAG: preprotein translocase subunit SecE [Acidithiobacillus sp.]|nr:preprotein translocase subunit SecE [Acidithiobacillus sp.]